MADRIERFLGPVQARDAEVIEHWRRTSPAAHASAMIDLAHYAEHMVSQTGYGKDPAERFPGFPAVRRRSPFSRPPFGERTDHRQMNEGGSPPRQPGDEPAWSEKVVQLHQAMADLGVPYAFGGAIALNYHREPRSTLDIDLNIFVPPDQEATVMEALSDLFVVADRARLEKELREHAQTRASWGHTFIDLFFSNTDFHTSMSQRIERQPFGEATIPVLSIEDLMVCKVLYDRPKDWVDIEAVIQTKRADLDGEYVRSWAEAFLSNADPRMKRLDALLKSGRR